MTSYQLKSVISYRLRATASLLSNVGHYYGN